MQVKLSADEVFQLFDPEGLYSSSSADTQSYPPDLSTSSKCDCILSYPSL